MLGTFGHAMCASWQEREVQAVYPLHGEAASAEIGPNSPRTVTDREVWRVHQFARSGSGAEVGAARAPPLRISAGIHHSHVF